MPISERSRITAATDALYLRVRHPAAWGSAGAPTISWEAGYESLRGRKYGLLTTFRKSGEPIPTPVWFGVADDRIYVRSEAEVGKIKRIRNNSRVRIAPCTLRGRPLGPPVEGRARILASGDSVRAERAIAANYGLFRKLYEGVGQRLPIDAVYIEIARPTHGAEKE